jgi:hypothetical protein
MKKLALAALTLLILTASPAPASELDGRWLHIRVEEHEGDEEFVSVNLPLSVVEAILPTIETDEFSHGKVFLDHDELDGIDLRTLLEAVRDTPDAEFVTVRSRDETVRVAKEKGFMVVLAEESDGEKVRVRIPMAVVDAAIAGSDNELDLLAALRVLADYAEGDLVLVESDDTTVRIWIDSSDVGD